MTPAASDPLISYLRHDAAGDVMHSDRIDRILASVREHLGMEIAFVSRYVEGDQREFTHISTDLPLPHRPGLREPRAESFCWHILEGRLPELIHDAADHELAKSLPITNALPVGCHLNVPLRFSDGQVYGSFCALSRSVDRSITERDMGVLRAFADLAIDSIEAEFGADLASQRIRGAVERVIAWREITILHQPIHDLRTGLPVGAECLARFSDAQSRGPDAWFAEAGRVGLDVELEMLALELALETLPYVPQGNYLSMNASPATILSGRVHDLMRCATPERITIELTEHNAVTDYAELARALKSLSAHAKIAIDDVGAGYAGLRHIVDLAPHTLKLDMGLTRHVDRDPARDALCAAMVRFAAKSGMTLTAEGIESEAEAIRLAQLGVTCGQGYFFARPMPPVRAQLHLLGMSQDAAEPASPPAAAAAAPAPRRAGRPTR